MRSTYFLLIIIFISGCTKDNLENQNRVNDFHVFYYEGSAWTGWIYELSIDTCGIMSVYEQKYLPRESERIDNYKLLDEEIDSIKQDLILLRKIKLKDYGFGPGKPTDLPTTFFKYSLNSISDSSGIYVPVMDEVPKELLLALGTISRLRIKYDIKK